MESRQELVVSRVHHILLPTRSVFPPHLNPPSAPIFSPSSLLTLSPLVVPLFPPHLIFASFLIDLDTFLGLIQLSFLTFLHLHSFQSLETYQTLLTLLSRSSIKELSGFDHRYSNLLIQLIVILVSQLKELDNDFFVEMQDPQLENWFFKTLDLFRIQLKRGRLEIAEGHWSCLQHTCQRFDWNLGDLTYDTELGSEEDVESSDEDEDEKPVVVETWKLLDKLSVFLSYIAHLISSEVSEFRSLKVVFFCWFVASC